MGRINCIFILVLINNFDTNFLNAISKKCKANASWQYNPQIYNLYANSLASVLIIKKSRENHEQLFLSTFRKKSIGGLNTQVMNSISDM